MITNSKGNSGLCACFYHYFHTSLTITHDTISTLRQLSLTTGSSILRQPSLTPHYLNHHSHYPEHRSCSTLPQHHSQPTLHTTSTITHNPRSTLPQPSLTTVPPHYLKHHSQPTLHTTSTITHGDSSTLRHHHSQRTAQSTSTITDSLTSTLPQPSLTA